MFGVAFLQRLEGSQSINLLGIRQKSGLCKENSKGDVLRQKQQKTNLTRAVHLWKIASRGRSEMVRKTLVFKTL